LQPWNDHDDDHDYGNYCDVDTNSAWESTKENMKASATQSILL